MITSEQNFEKFRTYKKRKQKDKIKFQHPTILERYEETVARVTSCRVSSLAFITHYD